VPDLLHLTAADARRLRWKNGLGVTEELAIWPREAAFEDGDFDWRISRASVVEDGPFSEFPGFDRVLVVVEGDGLVLEHGDRAPRAEVRRLEPYAFAGDWPTIAELVGGPVQDFNLILRRERVRGDVRPLRLDGGPATIEILSGHSFLHALDGEISTEQHRLARGDSMWFRGDRGRLELTGPATALLVSIADR
jgi:environmental stress-induced protein Ves